MTSSLFASIRHYFLLALLGLSFTACLPSIDVPETEDLHGAWENIDGDMHRIMAFAGVDGEREELAGLSNVYRLYVYPDGAEPVIVQTGQYRVEVRLLNVNGEQVETDALVMRVLWDAQGLYTGNEYGNPIVDYDGVSLTIGGVATATGERTYEATDVAL